ncbi:hypothetical protein BG005_011087 [Podila minutissima]|nr:hypothetical protein BG005_011087 [Podila minutissima]
MDDSRAFIWARLGAMLLQRYPENLHKITFDICDARRYLPLTDRLEKLGTVFLHYFRGMTDGHVQDTVSFLSRNRIAYPRKKPVQIEFGVEWDAPWNQKHASERQRHQSWIKLIKAVGHPVQIDSSRSPGFYEDILEGIELARWKPLWTRIAIVSGMEKVPPRNFSCTTAQFWKYSVWFPVLIRDSPDFQTTCIASPPVWKLSRIKSLRLVGVAALQFNFDSLDHCTDLETLILECNSEFGRLMPINRCVVLKYLQLTAHDLIGSNILLCSKDDSTATSIVSPTETQTAALNTRPQTETLRVERIEDDLDLAGPGGTQYSISATDDPRSSGQ